MRKPAFWKALFNHQGQTCAKVFMEHGWNQLKVPIKGSLLDSHSLSADQTTSGIGPPSERIVTVCIG